MAEKNPALAGLPDPGNPIFYPKVGHCIYRGVTEDRVAPGTELLELEDMEESSRILIPLSRIPQLNLRAAGGAFDEIKEILSSEYEEPIEDDDERHALTEKLIADGSPAALARALKQLHLLRQTTGLEREEELTRKKVRSWLAAEVSISRDSTRAEAQAFMTRVLQDSMAEHERKEKEEAKERRRAAREQRKAEEAANIEQAKHDEQHPATNAATGADDGKGAPGLSASESAPGVASPVRDEENPLGS